MPPQNVLHWHVHYIKLKTVRAQQVQEELCSSPLTA